MIYCDTSFLIPHFFEEATSTAINAVLAAVSAGSLLISSWTELEFSSVMAKENRKGQITAAEAVRGLDDFARFVEANCMVTTPISRDFAQARLYVGDGRTGLRSGDALHLAIAANRRASMIHSLDKGLLRAAAILGLPASTGITAP